MTTQFLRSAVGLFLAQSILAAVVVAAAPRVLPEGKLPNDIRLEPLKDLDGYFPFTPPKSKAEWDEAGRARATADSRLAGTLAHADQNAAQCGDSREDRSWRPHRGESLFRKRAGLLCHRQSLSPKEHRGQSAGRHVCARPLGQRATFGIDRRGIAPRTRGRRRAF